MFVPPVFKEDDPAVLAALIRTHGFGTLMTQIDNAPFATHLPFLFDPQRGPHGTITAHMARANPHWKAFDGAAPSLVVFQGPHAYISPRWYGPGEFVPTWNYAVAHCYGAPGIVEDRDTVLAMMRRLIETYEGPDGWSMDGLSEDYVDGMLKGIVAFDIPLDRIEGKVKINQNHPEANARGAIEGLRATGRPEDAAMADLMARRREDG
jgi:transcriptional regulator